MATTTRAISPVATQPTIVSLRLALNRPMASALVTSIIIIAIIGIETIPFMTASRQKRLVALQ